jgi:hypothetical protein
MVRVSGVGEVLQLVRQVDDVEHGLAAPAREVVKLVRVLHALERDVRDGRQTLSLIHQGSPRSGYDKRFPFPPTR